ncbi:MAG: RNA polymerase sigma factor [Prolixibacteraceae bacterium]|jgi:RNA polymerase sigma-70 factor (ECF subfamily)|nr:RNA polymerase sigma factor [Prolixibacteraceae bacterium]
MSVDPFIKELKNVSTKQGAFQQLVEKHQEKLYWHVRKMVLNHADADDILQNTFVKVWNNIDNFRGDSSLYTWTYRIATNETLTFLAQQKRRNIFSSSTDNDYLAKKLESDEYFDGTEIQRKLQEAIITLPEKQRIVFNMKYFDEVKYKDMSEILETSVGALKASYHHAVKKIEAFLRNDEMNF